MTKKIDITPSELVLSAIFFLQQKNGVSEKEITRFISKKVGCKASLVSKEVKEALDKAIESGIFTRKQGLYRIESSLGNDLKSIKKNLTKENVRDEDFDLQDGIHSPFKSCESTEDRWLNSQSSKSDRISLNQIDLLKSKGMDDDDDEEDFLEDEDDELDFFDDDQFSDTYSVKQDSPPPVKTTCSNKRHGHRHRSRNKGKNGGSKSKRRKSMRPRKRMMRRKKQQLMCNCKNSEYSSRAPLKSSKKQKAGNEVCAKRETSRGAQRKQNKQSHKPEETDKNAEVNKRGKKGKKAKDSNAQYGSSRFCKDCNCSSVQEAKRDVQSQDPKDEAKTVTAKEDQAKKSPKEEQLKRKGKDVKSNEEKEVSKKPEEAAPKKDGKAQPSAVKAANPTEVPSEREWRRRKAKRERSSSLFRPIKKKMSSKEKSLTEQKSAKNKTNK